jgi:hypothetical protein
MSHSHSVAEPDKKRTSDTICLDELRERTEEAAETEEAKARDNANQIYVLRAENCIVRLETQGIDEVGVREELDDLARTIKTIIEDLGNLVSLL